MPNLITASSVDSEGIQGNLLQTNVDVGAQPNRVLVVFMWAQFGGDITINTATYGGNPMTVVASTVPSQAPAGVSVSLSVLVLEGDANVPSGSNQLSVQVSSTAADPTNWGIAWAAYYDASAFGAGSLVKQDALPPITQNLASAVDRVGLDFLVKRTTADPTATGTATHVVIYEDLTVPGGNSISIGETNPAAASLDMGWTGYGGVQDTIHYITEVLPVVAPAGTILSENCANAGCDAVMDLVDAAASPGRLQLSSAPPDYSGAGLVGEFVLQQPAWSAAAARIKTLLGVPLAGVAANDGTPTQARLVDGDLNEVASFDAGAQGSGDELESPFPATTAGEDMELTGLTAEMPDQPAGP